ncbi:MmgE/PrpD family protein [Ferrovibrio terrae]|uniref:MmgE/PrpD family protein n=1 Tax=Ferrovibrio terrae TaxID=2594003 RepID=A0A516H5N7_9PROT|nr:MmgE/PrpD family protein [Ferrovibrio terrae]QDO99078.1 MmgE/PrpD family protein [Ferrovibrio terrae]
MTALAPLSLPAASLTSRLAALIAARPIGVEDYRAAALFTLDALANALAGRRTTAGEILLDWADAEPLTTGREAMLLGGLTHILEVDDLHRASVVHPGCVVVPAAYTLARRRNLRGHAFLAAVLRGFEACCRVGMAVGPAHYRIWHNTATCGPFGSAYAAGDILGLDHAAMTDALGNAGTQSSGLWQFLETGAMSKHLHAGRAAEAGLLAADLAARGFSGPPQILEGEKGFFKATCADPKPERLLADPDAPWQLRLTSIKPWPCCRHTHPTIDAGLSLAAKIGNRNIERIKVATYQAALDVCDRVAPRSEYEAKFSLQHTAAAALTDGHVDFASFDPAARDRLAATAARVEIIAAPPYVRRYPVAWGAEVTVQLDDGSELSASREHAYGDPENPLDQSAMRAKATMLLEYAGIAAPAKFIDAVLALAEDAALPDLPPVQP